MMDYLKFFSEVFFHAVLFAFLFGGGISLLVFAGSFLSWLIAKSREERSEWKNWDR